MPEISGPAVAVAVGGAVLIYAGLRGVSPLSALRDIVSGNPPPVPVGSAGLDTGVGAAGAAAAISGARGLTGAQLGQAVAGAAGVGAALARAAASHSGERYSQVRRWQPGYSDCSSFVGKALRDIGITPPGPSLAASYLTWGALRKIDRSALGVGDLVANTAHIVIATGPNSAIGQQNPFQHVRTGTPESLMWGTGTFTCLRYVGKG